MFLAHFIIEALGDYPPRALAGFGVFGSIVLVAVPLGSFA